MIYYNIFITKIMCFLIQAASIVYYLGLSVDPAPRVVGTIMRVNDNNRIRQSGEPWGTFIVYLGSV